MNATTSAAAPDQQQAFAQYLLASDQKYRDLLTRVHGPGSSKLGLLIQGLLSLFAWLLPYTHPCET